MKAKIFLRYSFFTLIIQERIVAELMQLGLLTSNGHVARLLHFDDLRELANLGNVIKESMRMFPVVAGIPRCIPLARSIIVDLKIVPTRAKLICWERSGSEQIVILKRFGRGSLLILSFL